MNAEYKIVPAKGPIDSPFVIVGEAPGRQEVKLGQPFVGPSGMVLDHALNQFPKGSYPAPYFTNVVPHLLQVDKDPAILSKFASEHTPRLIEELKQHPRKVILALGAVALWALTGDHSLKITKRRGEVFKSPFAESGIVAATHPAFLLRGNGSFRQFKADIAYAINLANGGQPHQFTPPTWEYVDTIEKVNVFLAKVEAHKGIIAGDIETGGFSHRMDKILVAGFTLDGKHVYVIPGRKREYKPEQNMLPYIGVMWDKTFAPNVKYCWHNGKFDVKFFWHQYNQTARVDEDTMLMSYALDETRGIHDLEQVAGDWLGSPNWKGILDSHKKAGDSYDVIPESVLTKYMAYDIANTYNLVPILRPLISMDAGSERLYTKTLIPGSHFLAIVEACGMAVDKSRVKENAEAYEAEANIYETEIQAIAKAAGLAESEQQTTKNGKKIKKVMAINVNSPTQLSPFLFDTLKIPTKDRSTNKEVLENLPDHPVVLALRKYRKINKGLSTYITPVEDHLQDDGRVHQSYLLHGTATGRLACRDPNLQNIPREPKLRGQFIPREGYCYVEVDLNQAELRSLACLSGDDELCRIYTDPNSNGLHNEVRQDLYGDPANWNDFLFEKYQNKWYITGDSKEAILKRILEEQKMRCKNVNFGIVYGVTPFGLAEQIEDTPQEAARMLAGWATKFPKAWGFINLCRAAPLKGQNLVTVFGHKKRFGIVTPETLASIQNEAANFPHQSTASTITIHGGMRIQDKLRREYDTDIVNLVHDSILMEVPESYEAVEAVAKIAIDELEQVPIDWGITRIPFKAEAKVGSRWGSLEDIITWRRIWEDNHQPLIDTNFAS